MAVSVPPEAAGSVPPHNLEAEVSVLGAILLAEQALDGLLIDVRLSAEDFYRERHRVIFRAMLRLKEKTVPEPIDALTLSEELNRSGELEEAGGTAYVHSLPNLVPAAGNARHYGKIVKEHALLRRLLDTTRDIQEKALSVKGQPSELVEQAEQAMYKIAHDEHASEIRSIDEVLHDELDKLEQISRDGISLIGTPSGFRDLDDITGGFQPGNLIVLAARPAMGKCLTGGSLIYDPKSGSRRRLDELVANREQGAEEWVLAAGDDLKLRAAPVSLVARSGVKPVFRLTTRLGRRIEATANHPLLTIDGWRQLDELTVGDRIGVPRRLPEVELPRAIPDHELVLLAALIADGNLTQKTPRFCYGAESAVLPEVEEAAAAVGCRLRCSPRSNGTATISAGRGAPRNPVRELMSEHGLWGKRSGEKFVPDQVFNLDEGQIARFLGILFACDGHVYASDRLRQVGYTTISERLARDVQHLLLRLGIVGCIRTLKRDVYAGTTTVAREVRITGQEGLRAFAQLVRVPGKQDRIARLLEGLDRAPRSTNVDTVPVEVWPQVVAAKGGSPWREVSVATGRPSNHNWHVGTRGLSRELLGELAGWSGDEQLGNLATSDLWWDEVTSIEALGKAETYDIAVPDGHNFVADDIVVHNSALVVNIAENASVDHGKGVALFSLEMSETELAQRFIASQAKLDGDELRKGRVKPDRWPKVIRATEQLSKAKMFVDDSSDLGVMELRAKARRLHSRTPLGLIVIDYLQLMRPEDSSVGRVEQIGQMSRGLKILARELHVPVIAVSQLSRAVESRPDKRPLLSDLRESGCLTGDARVFLPESGTHARIEDLVGRAGFKVQAVDRETWRLEQREVTKAFCTGVKPTFKLRTCLGKEIKATANHKFLTIDGWRRLDELDEGTHLTVKAAAQSPRGHALAAAAPHLLQGSLDVTSPEPLELAHSDVYWDEVVSIQPAGPEPVYDLTVDELHNFVANDIVVHNSIEQDADVVLFIYRDEYYNRETTEAPGEAELIVSKHRNGPVGKVSLAFMERYPKFANLWRDSGGDVPTGGGSNGGG